VLPAPAAQQRYGRCTTGIERAIPAALRPRSVEDVTAIVDIARRHRVPLYPISTGNNWGYGSANPARDGCVVVDLSGLDRIVAIDPELGLATVEPGVTQQALHDQLEARRLPFMVPTTGGGPHCSLVGNALERGYGITPYADHFGAVTALEAVLPDGRLYRSALSELGGPMVDRAFKWKVGPFLDGLFAQNGLGIVTRMTIALAPRPQRTQAFLFAIADDAGLDAAVPAIRQVLRNLGGVAGSINLMNARRVLAMTVPYPPDRAEGTILPRDAVDALARRNGVTAWTGLGALYGTSRIVAAARREIRAGLRPAVDRLRFLTPAAAAVLNRWLCRVPGLGGSPLVRRAEALDGALRLLDGRPGEVALPLAYWRSGARPMPGAALDPARDGCGLLWYTPLVPMLPDRVRRFVSIYEEVCARHAIEPLLTLTSLSERCFDCSAPLLFDRADPQATARAQSCYRELLDAGAREGFLPYRLGVGAMDWLARPGLPYWDLTAAIKAAVDPVGIIAPGRYGP
jgi:FAD/FMN-containing dehydrogenase